MIPGTGAPESLTITTSLRRPAVAVTDTRPSGSTSREPSGGYTAVAAGTGEGEGATLEALASTDGQPVAQRSSVVAVSAPSIPITTNAARPASPRVHGDPLATRLPKLVMSGGRVATLRRPPLHLLSTIYYLLSTYEHSRWSNCGLLLPEVEAPHRQRCRRNFRLARQRAHPTKYGA